MSSAALRLFAKQIVRWPAVTSWARMRAASPSGLARRPISSSRIGGFQNATVRSACAAASFETTRTSSPVSAAACSPGFAIVAEARRNCGSAP